MTDTTDIASLMLKMRTLADRIIDAEGENNNGEVGQIIEMYDAADTTFKAQNILLVLNALEAERQQREKADRAVAAECLLRKASDKAFNEQYDRAEKAEASVGVLEGIIARKEFDSLKADQVPVGWVKVTADKALSWDSVDPIYLAGSNAPVGWRSDYKPVYNRPQKPVISKEKLCDWLEDNFDINDSQRAAFAACFSHCCDCIVQSELPAPVGEIVAWAGTDREKGITREVDFRFLRFDVMPGTKLYALKPAPAILTDVLAAISFGDSPTELIEALTAIKPKFGAPGSRDSDVRAANLAIDKAIEKLSNL